MNRRGKFQLLKCCQVSVYQYAIDMSQIYEKLLVAILRVELM